MPRNRILSLIFALLASAAQAQNPGGVVFQGAPPWAISATTLPLPSLAATSTKQSDGTQKSQIVDGSGNVIGATSNALDVNIKSGFGSSIAVTQSTSPWVSNTSQINGVIPLMGNGVTGTGSQRVTIASDNTAFPVNATLSAETIKVIGTVNQGTSPWVVSATNLSTNVAQINGVTPLMGNGATGTGSQRVTIASDNTAFAVNSTLSAETTKVIGTVNVASAQTIATTNAGTFAVQSQPTPVTSGGLSVYFVQPTASDNHAVIKAGAGQVYKISATNNSATINYLRLYNATTGFNGCNSATNIVYQMAIPASTSASGISDSWDSGMAFATGISICVTSAYAQTDTTNATASALSVNIGYK